MRRAFILVVFVFGYFTSALAQQKLTTFILIRHVEKVIDGFSKDPNLSDAGKKRAESLVPLFQNTSIQAIYSTTFIRTRDTVTPLAKAKSLAITEYDALKPESIHKILKDFYGGTILICGHSNNIPLIANYLTGTDELKSFDDDDYGNILIVSVAEIGKVTSVTRLRY